ncbi:MAG: hypothetical protein JWO80_2944 [Bryobacterales bacterium]|nr:hypothetical protein [Bryobacterales bacterium]
MFSRRAALLALTLLGPQTGYGQFLIASGGASSLTDAYGAKLDYRYAPFSGWLGLGFNRGFHVGSTTGASWRGMDFAAGDKFYPFLLATDVFDRSYYFDGRGLTVSRHSRSDSWMAFAGASTSEFNTSFARTFRVEQAAGAFFYERRFGPRITLQSSNILSRGLTSIQSVGVAVTPNWKLDAAAGVGTGHGMFSAATEYKNKWLILAGSLTAADNRFQRLHVSNPVFSERRGANLQARITPFARLSVTLGHENIAPPVMLPTVSRNVSLNTVAVSTSVAGFGLTAGESVSRSGYLSASTQLFTLSRRLSPRFTGYAFAVRSQSGNQPRRNLYMGTVQGSISPRLTLDGTVTRTASGTSFSAGGQFLSNLAVIGIHNQTVVNLLAGGFNGRPVVQAWTVSLQFHVPGGIGIHCDSILDGYGKVRYTAFATGMALAGQERPAGAPAPALNLGRYVVQGIVQDENGEPIWGIPVRVHDELLYSNSRGVFSVRLKKRGNYRVTVLPEQALNQARWEVVSGSLWVQTGKEDPLLIIMRHGEGPVP